MKRPRNEKVGVRERERERIKREAKQKGRGRERIKGDVLLAKEGLNKNSTLIRSSLFEYFRISRIKRETIRKREGEGGEGREREGERGRGKSEREHVRKGMHRNSHKL